MIARALLAANTFVVFVHVSSLIATAAIHWCKLDLAGVVSLAEWPAGTIAGGHVIAVACACWTRVTVFSWRGEEHRVRYIHLSHSLSPGTQSTLLTAGSGPPVRETDAEICAPHHVCPESGAHADLAFHIAGAVHADLTTDTFDCQVSNKPYSVFIVTVRSQTYLFLNFWTDQNVTGSKHSLLICQFGAPVACVVDCKG